MFRPCANIAASFFVLVLLGVSAHPAQKPNEGSTTITITEPATYSLDQLYKAAHIVALVKILSGDTEHYGVVVYKGEVLESFKGTAAKQILYFGPFGGERLGSEYVLFLHKSSSQLSPKLEGEPSYGTIPYAAVFNEGYTSMETSYQCGFNGQAPNESCDYGVRVCTDYIKLPKSLASSTLEDKDTASSCRWIRKERFLAVLRSNAKLTAK